MTSNFEFQTSPLSNTRKRKASHDDTLMNDELASLKNRFGIHTQVIEQEDGSSAVEVLCEFRIPDLQLLNVKPPKIVLLEDNPD